MIIRRSAFNVHPARLQCLQTFDRCARCEHVPLVGYLRRARFHDLLETYRTASIHLYGADVHRHTRFLALYMFPSLFYRFKTKFHVAQCMFSWRNKTKDALATTEHIHWCDIYCNFSLRFTTLHAPVYRIQIALACTTRNEVGSETFYPHYVYLYIYFLCKSLWPTADLLHVYRNERHPCRLFTRSHAATIHVYARNLVHTCVVVVLAVGGRVTRRRKRWRVRDKRKNLGEKKPILNHSSHYLRSRCVLYALYFITVFIRRTTTRYAASTLLLNMCPFFGEWLIVWKVLGFYFDLACVCAVLEGIHIYVYASIFLNLRLITIYYVTKSSAVDVCRHIFTHVSNVPRSIHIRSSFGLFESTILVYDDTFKGHIRT